MENIENLAAEQAAEKVEQTTEETQQEPKTYTQDEVDAIVGRKIARTKAKIQKEYDRKYGSLEEVLRAGTGKQNVEEITDTFREFYQQKGVQMPQKPGYSARDIEILARAEAEDIIRSGYDEVVEEVERLTELGAANMTDREKAIFKALAEHRQSAERSRELSRLGVSEEEYDSKEFQDFAGKFSPSTPVSEIYEIYRKTQPKKEHRTMGSMKHSTSDGGAVKDFYSREETLKFTKQDFDRDPALFKAVQQSMQKW